MTLGEKIRYARKICGLSQGQLAEKRCVSRSAIAKWETDKGIPDIENLKMLSRLLRVSVDSLLDDSADAEAAVIRKPIDLSDYGRGCGKVKKNRLMRQQFQDAQICTLMGRPELTAQSANADTTRGILTPAPFGTPEFMKSVRNMDRDYYLVEREEEQLFVTVADEWLEIRALSQKQTEKTFKVGSWLFIRCDCVTDESE